MAMIQLLVILVLLIPNSGEHYRSTAIAEPQHEDHEQRQDDAQKDPQTKPNERQANSPTN